jgi:hypothetical protein
LSYEAIIRQSEFDIAWSARNVSLDI